MTELDQAPRHLGGRRLWRLGFRPSTQATEFEEKPRVVILSCRNKSKRNSKKKLKERETYTKTLKWVGQQNVQKHSQLKGGRKPSLSVQVKPCHRQGKDDPECKLWVLLHPDGLAVNSNRPWKVTTFPGCLSMHFSQGTNIKKKSNSQQPAAPVAPVAVQK